MARTHENKDEHKQSEKKTPKNLLALEFH